MNITEYAKHSGRSKQLISKWLKPGKLLFSVHTREDGHISIDVAKADKLLVTQLDTAQSRKKDKVINEQFPLEDEERSLQDAIMQDKYYASALKKQKLDMIAGTLTLKVDEEKEVFDMARQTRDAILNVPDRISAIIATMDDEFKVNALLTKELVQALEALSV